MKLWVMVVAAVVVAMAAGGAQAQTSPGEAKQRLDERTIAKQAADIQKLKADLADRDAQIAELQKETKSLRDLLADAKVVRAADRVAAAQKVVDLEKEIAALKQAAAAPAAAPPVKPRGVSVKIGDVSVDVVDYGVGKVSLVRMGGDKSQSVEEFLWVRVRLTNNSDTRKINYRTWRGAGFSVGNDVATATDDFDNALKRIGFGLTTTPENAVEHGDSIYPGKAIEDLLVFERPVDKAKGVKIELPRRNVEAKGDGPVPVTITLK